MKHGIEVGAVAFVKTRQLARKLVNSSGVIAANQVLVQRLHDELARTCAAGLAGHLARLGVFFGLLQHSLQRFFWGRFHGRFIHPARPFH